MHAVIGIGSNLGDRVAFVTSAVARLRDALPVLCMSPVYETDPLGPPQGRFLNAALLVDSALSPHALLATLNAVERSLGRERRERWGPRTIDLDLLWIDGIIIANATLTVPHPGLLQRAFALRPLLDVAPDAIDPRDGSRLANAPRDDRGLVVFTDDALASGLSM